jgi:hypothetical protein
MKKLVLVAAVLMVSLFSINNAKAQVNVSINIGSQPLWGPTGYNHVDYYYLPDINAYYYVPSGQYIYENGGRWVWVNSLPPAYSNFDLYNAYKVVINKPRPYLQNNIYVAQYGRYKNYGGRQAIIRDSRDVRYDVIKGRPNYKPDNIKQVTVIRHQQNNGRSNRYPVATRQSQVIHVQKNRASHDDRNGGNLNRPERDNNQKANAHH